ncbi:MAG: glycosyltransferase [Nitrospinota bacterium]|nr:MAG: glycosyltransferase [Nitrospinota bacterium]
MKIVLIGKTPYGFPEENQRSYLAGHSLGFTDPFIKYALRKGHQVTLITPRVVSTEECTSPMPIVFPPTSDRFHHLWIFPRDLPKVPFPFTSLDTEAAILQASRLMGGIDIVMSIYVFPWILPVNHLKRALGYRSIAFIRGTDGINGLNPASVYRKLYGPLWEEMTRVFTLALQESDRIYVLSRWLRAYVQRFGVQVSGVLPTPPFPMLPEYLTYKAESVELKRMLVSQPVLRDTMRSVDLTKKWVIYFGRFHRDKSVHLLIEAIKHVRHASELTFILAGAGPEEEALRKLAEKLQIPDLHFCFIPPHLIPLFCRAATLMVHPAIPREEFVEALSNSCVNASAAGCPIILPHSRTIDCGGAEETVGPLNLRYLTFAPSSDEQQMHREIAAKIDFLVSHSALRQEIRQQNVLFARQFSQEAIFTALEREMECLLTES